MKRLFHFQDGKSDKFWEIERSGNSFTVRFGKIGTNGQSQTKEFEDAEKTEKEYNKLVAEKLKKGYVEQGPMPPVASTSAVSVPIAPIQQPRTPRLGSRLSRKRLHDRPFETVSRCRCHGNRRIRTRHSDLRLFGQRRTNDPFCSIYS